MNADKQVDVLFDLSWLTSEDTPPTSARVLDTWFVQAERAIGSEQSEALGKRVVRGRGGKRRARLGRGGAGPEGATRAVENVVCDVARVRDSA
ncbi:MAG TPA: hypothetical protein VGC04_04140 [Cellulomonas sp.]